jgi:hypothetical protein
MDERDVVVVLPLRRLRRDALPQERNRLVRTPRAPRVGFAQEDRAEPVRDREVRIERRRDVEQRVQQLVPPRLVGETIAAVVLQRADPVDIGGQRVEREDHAAEHRG